MKKILSGKGNQENTECFSTTILRDVTSNDKHSFQTAPECGLLVLFLVLASGILFSCSNKQDDQNYRRYLSQDRKIEGKAGILLTALGQPEEYDFAFFDRYLNQIFHAAFPPILQPIIMGDNGTVLMDPDQLDASKEFTPKKLIDCYGHTKNEEGVSYTELEVEWVTPRDEGSPGHFLWKEKNGYVDIVEKVSIKIVASYYGKMPNKKIPFRSNTLPFLMT